MPTVYSTTDVPPRESMEYWTEVVAAGFVKLSLTAARAFNGTVSIGSIGTLGIFAYDTDAHGVNRGKREISRADTDGYFICLQLTGKSVHLQGDREAIVESGSFFLLDPRQPFSGALAEAGKMIAVSVPRREIEARTGPGAPLVARTLNADNPVAALAFGFLTLLPDRIDTLDGAPAGKIAEQALDLVALAYSAETQSGVTLSSPRAAALTY